MEKKKKPPEPVHQPGTKKGEDTNKQLGKEPGRSKTDTTGKGEEDLGAAEQTGSEESQPMDATQPGYRTARDSTGVNPKDPIDPESPDMPPA